MLVGFADGELAHLLGGKIYNEDVQSLVIVEARHAFAGIRLVEIAGDDHGIAGSLRSQSTGRGRDEGKLLAVGRPGHFPAGAGERAVGASARSKKSDFRTIRARDEKAALVTVSAQKS